MPTPVKHTDLSVQQISDIQKKLLVSLRGDNNFWDKFCSHEKVNDGYSAYEWRKLNITNLTQADIVNLTEGVTPAALSLTYSKYKVTPVNYGKHIEYTDEAEKYNFDNVVADSKIVLSEHAKEQAEYRKALAYISGACTMSPTEANITSANFDFLGDLLKARTILKKNHIKPISANRYGVILTSEVAAKVLIKYKDAITHTSQKEALIDGYLGELAGFVLFESVHPALYAEYTIDASVTSSNFAEKKANLYTLVDGAYTSAASGSYSSTTTYYVKSETSYVLFIGKTEYGMPVQTVSFGNASVDIINHPLGSGVSVDASGNIVADALNQHGTVGYKVMGFAARILFDEAVIRCAYTNVAENSLAVVEANRFGYQASSTSPSA